MAKIKVMCVCLGNICRSPLAEAVLRHKAHDQGIADRLEIRSSGTAAYHIGHDADPRTIKVANKNGIKMDHTAQQFRQEFFEEYDYIFAMDDSNYQNIMNLYRGESEVEVVKFRKYDDESSELDVFDPYYGGENGFDEIFALISECSENFLQSLKSNSSKL